LLLQLTVTAGNAPAQRLYARMAFQIYGIERRAVQVCGRFYDEELMVLDLDC
jgi:RimJ/RimL family protein N-acetyltransferase